MNKLNLEIINPEGLVKKINENLFSEKEPISIVEVKRKNNGYFLKKTYHIKQSVYFAPLSSNAKAFLRGMDIADDKKIGSISVKAGVEDDGRYEMLTFKIDKPIRLNNSTIPRCKVLIQEQDGYYKTCREDYIPEKLFGWRKALLSNVLPTEWFLE